MANLTVFEFQLLVGDAQGAVDATDVHAIPEPVFAWLERESLRASEDGTTNWSRLAQYRGRRAIRLSGYVGVLRAPCGYQIEVLPKIGKDEGSDPNQVRDLLLGMLGCLRQFRHLRVDRASLAARRMPLLDVFIGEFLLSVRDVVKRGLRRDYLAKQGNLPVLRGKLMMAAHLRDNLVRADRFHTEHDEFCDQRPENRILHAALRRVLALARSTEHQRLARELLFVFTDIPLPTDVTLAFRQVRIDRGMGYYEPALDWARLILTGHSPLTGSGGNLATSMLFPMEAVFEAFVGKHLRKQLKPGAVLREQVQEKHLVQHQTQQWFRLKPDFLLRQGDRYPVVLDTKWKLLDQNQTEAKHKYGLSQSDFYQMQAYCLAYMPDGGHVVLVYPRTRLFNQALPVFEFQLDQRFKLWVVPFCLKDRTLLLPPDCDKDLVDIIGL